LFHVSTGVFIQQTFKIAALDEEIMINDKKIQSKAYLSNLEHLFDNLDTRKRGSVSRRVFLEVLEDPLIRTWFSAVGVDVDDLEFSDFVGPGKSAITKDDFKRESSL